MLISLRWIGRHVEIDLEKLDVDELANRFTLSVAELEGVVRFDTLDGVVVARVERAEPIPGSKLRVCSVSAGGEARQIVCGASNFAAGQTVAVALPGARLGAIEIGVRRVHGVESHGVICSEQELGIGPGEDGILVLPNGLEPGTRLHDVAPVSDVLFEIDNKSLTHRPDLWGHRGVAREIAALLGRPLAPLPEPLPLGTEPPCEVRVLAPDACPRYCAVALRGVAPAPSPLWLRILLHRVGTRPISNVVDATNFVMLDLGNPLHAFDRKKLRGSHIEVRFAKAAEAIRTLDGMERVLTDRDLVIADQHEPVALAGIMGAGPTGVEHNTTDVMLEAANFDAAIIRQTAQRQGMRTEASMRFEKSLDPRLPDQAAHAFVRLVKELCPGAEVASSLVSAGPPLPALTRVELRLSETRRRLGVELPKEFVVRSLSALAFDVRVKNEDTLDVGIPSFRATKDITQEVDLIEEVGRSYGYNNIPPVPPLVAAEPPPPSIKKKRERIVRGYLTRAAGLDEVLSYSFSSNGFLAKIGVPTRTRSVVRNPISADLTTLRTDLATGLLAFLNQNAHNESISIFEIGRVFLEPPAAGELPAQPTLLAALSASADTKPDASAAQFFRTKGILSGLISVLERPALVLERATDAPFWAHPARQATIVCAGRILGHIAEVHPRILARLERPFQAAAFELDLDALGAVARAERSFVPPPSFPAVLRDFAFVVPEAVSAEELRSAMAGAADHLEGIGFQSLYRGVGIPEGHKSLAWSVAFRHPDRTLTDSEVEGLSQAILKAVEQRTGGRLR
jgi:phenylalanyl-tRNA synthetase beta chain